MKKAISLMITCFLLFTGCDTASALTGPGLDTNSNFNMVGNIISSPPSSDMTSMSVLSEASSSAYYVSTTSSSSYAISSNQTKSSAAPSKVASTSSVSGQGGIAVTISKVEPDPYTSTVYFQLSGTDGIVFDPGMCVMIGRYCLKDENGNEFSKGENLHCEISKTNACSISVATSRISNAKQLVLVLENVTVYKIKYSDATFNITDYLKAHPELNNQKPIIKPIKTDGANIIYEEPTLEKGGLNIKVAEDCFSTLDNLCYDGNFLVLRLQLNYKYWIDPPGFAIYQNQGIVQSSQTESNTLKGYYYQIYPLKSLENVTLKLLSYPVIIRQAEGQWSCSSALTSTPMETPQVINKADKTFEQNGNVYQLSEIACTTKSIKITLEYLKAAAKQPDGDGAGTALFGKNGRPLNEAAVVLYEGNSEIHTMETGFTPDKLGAVVLFTTNRDISHTCVILANFDFVAGSCKVYTYTTLPNNEGWPALGEMIASLYA